MILCFNSSVMRAPDCTNQLSLSSLHLILFTYKSPSQRTTLNIKHVSSSQTILAILYVVNILYGPVDALCVIQYR